jgi:D-serine deaminase-like pyridoxal phosphate-dependent protein
MELDTPVVVVDLDILEHNLQAMADLCRHAGVALRPHVKTHKTVEIGRRQLELGACGITVAKLGEADALAAHGFHDILIAYELIGEHKMRRLVNLLQRIPDLKVTVAVDGVPGAAALSDAGVQAGKAIPAVIEIDTGLGRAGVSSTEEAVSLARHMRLFPGIAVAGIFTHEGQVQRGGQDGMEERSRAAAAMMLATASAIRHIGLDCPVVSMGSTPSARWIAGASGVTEIRPGTYVFNDRSQRDLGVVSEECCALTILATVISVQPGGRVTLDAGSKTLSSDGVSRLGDYGVILEDSEARLSVCSEEHGHLDTSRSSRPYQVGERVHILPNHVCVVVNLTDHIYGYRSDALECEWPVETRGLVR